MKYYGKITDPKDWVTKEYADSKQAKVTASGILKGDGQGGVSAATAGTDYGTYSKPSTGIPKTDLASDVQTSLGKADTALQQHQSLAAYRTATDQDAIDAGKEAAGLGLTGASVGDLVRVNAVDSNGKPTSWKHVPLNEIKCNKNYLINHYMVGGGSQLGNGAFPINQRGQTTYSNNGYGLDRWKKTSDYGSVTIGTDYIELKNTSDSQIRVAQIVETIPNGAYTLSALIKEVVGDVYLRCELIKSPYTIYHYIKVSQGLIWYPGTLSHNGAEIMVDFQLTPQSSVKFQDVKLEPGSEQTLAHNEGTEANPIWVLNEIPDYGEELRKCQTSRADSTDTYGNQEIAIINRNPGAHNSIYRGKYLGSSVTAAQYAAISSGKFDDLFVGDYWTINNVNWRIAAFDYWLRTGDKNWNDGNGNYTVSYESTHHIVIVPDTNLYNAQMHNTESGAYTEGAANNPTTGAYIGSDMYTTNLARAKTIVNDAFGAAHILNHREYLKNAVNGAYESAGAWYDSTVELMTEQMVYGGKIFANALQAGSWAAQYTIDKSQLPLFALEPSRICNRAGWWLRGVASSTHFALVGGNGDASAYYSSYPFGVRPAFGIKA